MDRVALLRWGYGALGLSFAAFGASVVAGGLIFVGILFALLGGLLLALSGDDLPRWAGVALLLYFLVSLAAFVAATPVTVRLEFFKGFVNDDPSPLATALFDHLVLALPLVIGGTAVAAAWEREWPPRILLWGALGGFVVVAILTVALLPSGDATRASFSTAQTQGRLLEILFGLSGGLGTLGALWAATRPDEYA